MGRFLPICSGAGKSLLPDPPPKAILVSIADCGTGPVALRNMIEFIRTSGTGQLAMDNGMFPYFKKWQKGELVICDKSRPIYPNNGISMNLTPSHNIYYANILKPYFFIVHDLPVPKLVHPYDVGEQEFWFLLVSYHNIKRAIETLRLREKYGIDSQLYFAFQGYNINQLLRVLEEIKDLKFSGFCLATRALSWNRMVALMLMLRHRGTRKIHILAGSNLAAMAVNAFLAKNLFDEISYDSANWTTFGMYQYFRVFGSMRAIRLKSDKPINNYLKHIRCNCQHCKGRTLGDIHDMPEGTPKHHLLAQHNYLVETQTAQAMFDHSVTPGMLRDFLLAHSNRTKLITEIHQCLSSIYNMMDKFNDSKFIRGFCEYIYHTFKAT